MTAAELLTGLEARGAMGSGTVAYFETDAVGVTLLDVSEAQSDWIPALPILLSRQRSILTRLTALESGGGGGGGGFAYSGAAPWLPDPGDDRRTDIVVPELIDLKIANALESQGGTPTRENPEYRALIGEQGAIGVGLAEIHPDSTLRSNATTIIIGITGDGSASTIDDLNEGTATVNADDATIGA